MKNRKTNKLNFKKYYKKVSFLIDYFYLNATIKDLNAKFDFLNLAYSLWIKEKKINNHTYFILRKIIVKSGCNKYLFISEFEKIILEYLNKYNGLVF